MKEHGPTKKEGQKVFGIDLETSLTVSIHWIEAEDGKDCYARVLNESKNRLRPLGNNEGTAYTPLN